MGKFLRKAAVASAVALAFSGTAFAQATLTNGSVTANLQASGNFNIGEGTGLSYLGTEYTNLGYPLSWYQMTTTSPFGSFTADLTNNPLGATTTPAGSTAATTFGFGTLNVGMLHQLTAPNQMSTTVTLTNTGSDAVTGVNWAVGLDPDQGDFGPSTTPVTRNMITGTGGSAAVTAWDIDGVFAPITLANTTGAGAFTVAAYINIPGGCCSTFDGATALAGGQILGFTNTADDNIGLGYDLGTIAAGQTISFGYSYTFAAPVPEPETYAMLLAGLGLMGFVARRRQKKLAAA